MKKTILALALVAGFSTVAMAAELKGYIIDEKCSAKPGMRGNVELPQRALRADLRPFWSPKRAKSTSRRSGESSALGW